MSKFRSKVVEINATRFEPGTGHFGFVDYPIWLAHALYERVLVICDDQMIIRTLEGEMTVNPGDWIIRGTEDELYPCKPSVFERKYEAVE